MPQTTLSERTASRVQTVPDAVARAVAEYGDAEALVDGGTRWSFAELGERVYRCAGAMIAAGVARGDRVAIWAPNGHRFVVTALGALVAGATVVPVNTRYKGDEARWIIEKSRARALFVENHFLGLDYVEMLGTAPLADLVDVVRLDGAGELTWEAFLERGDRVPREDVLSRGQEVAASDLSDVFFTSGTTGRPKGVMTNHSQNIRVCEAWGNGVGLRRGDRYLVVNPMFHSFGYKAGLIACLLHGVTLVTQAVFDVASTLDLIEAERITVLPGAPTLYASILDHPRSATADTSSLRLAVTGAAVVPVSLIERLRSDLFPEVIVAYGLTETCGTVTIGDPTASAEAISRTVGRPIEGTEVCIVGEDGERLPTGASGEIYVRGVNVMQGYLDDDVETAKAIDEDGWLHTGDVGRFDDEGFLRITDRLKDMFVVGGFNAYPAEIEQVIARHPAVSEVAVVGVPDERLGEVGRAYVVARQGHHADGADIIAHCRERLANFKVPRSVVFLEELPHNSSGKVVKFALR